MKIVRKVTKTTRAAKALGRVPVKDEAAPASNKDQNTYRTRDMVAGGTRGRGLAR